MRLFVAVDIPDVVCEELHRVQSALRVVPARCTFSNDFHITIGFWINGNVDVVMDRLSKLKYHSFVASIDDIGTFGSPPRVVWVGVKGQFADLAQKVQRAEKFSSHITLFRIKKIFDIKKFLGIIKKTSINNLHFNVETISLYTSTPSNGGHIHKKVASFNLDS